MVTVNITISALDEAEVQRVLSRPESKRLIEAFAAKALLKERPDHLIKTLMKEEVDNG